MRRAWSDCDEVPVVNLDHPASGKLERECLERYACLKMANLVDHGRCLVPQVEPDNQRVGAKNHGDVDQLPCHQRPDQISLQFR